jgi:hypothetical protein
VVSNATTADDGVLYRVVVHNTQNPAATSASARLLVAPSVGSAPVRLGGGMSHSVALRADATLVAWGGNGVGQLGRGTVGANEGAQPVSGLSRVATFAVGSQHTLAIDDQGVVSSWGTSANGVLGTTAVAGGSLAATVAGLGGPARFVSAGRTTSIAATGSDFYSWGAGYHGDSQYAVRTTPSALPGYAFVVAAAGRGDHTLAISSDGTVWAWGHNSYGQLGTGDFTARIAPEVVTGLPRALAVAAGVRHSLALSENGTVYAWGGNFSGELGTGDGADRNRPVAVPLPGIAVAIATGLYHSMALLADGRVFAWGYNSEGRGGARRSARCADAGAGRRRLVGPDRRHRCGRPPFARRRRQRRGLGLGPERHDAARRRHRHPAQPAGANPGSEPQLKRQHFILGLVALAAAGPLVSIRAAAQPSASAIEVNGKPLDARGLEVLRRLEATLGTVPPGRYWYDAASGGAGTWGGPASAYVGPGLALGGPLPANASGGGHGRLTGVFINGRELHPLDVQGLSRLGPVIPGRYWWDASATSGSRAGRCSSISTPSRRRGRRPTTPTTGPAPAARAPTSARAAPRCMAGCARARRAAAIRTTSAAEQVGPRP